mmetsp:Transcript_25600/g.60470  ORF Transcript_25600/g.60470 Transcript_25600/m.60470 type:complete len:83 (-) Transcript_25600:127-375(-)
MILSTCRIQPVLATDLWAVGVMLFHCIAGSSPFTKVPQIISSNATQNNLNTSPRPRSFGKRCRVCEEEGVPRDREEEAWKMR